MSIDLGLDRHWLGHWDLSLSTDDLGQVLGIQTQDEDLGTTPVDLGPGSKNLDAGIGILPLAFVDLGLVPENRTRVRRPRDQSL